MYKIQLTLPCAGDIENNGPEQNQLTDKTPMHKFTHKCEC